MNYHVADIPAEKLSVINYAFADISPSGEVTLFDSWAAVERPYPGDTWEQPLRGNFNQLIKLKEQHPHLITMIAVGGWTLSGRFSDVALTTSSRRKFARSAVDFIRAYQFDGVDIDWEYPVAGGLPENVYRPQDKRNYTLLLQELREQLDQAGQEDGKYYYLTIAAGAGLDKIANLEVAEISGILDWINVMCYDFHGGWENVTDHHSPLYGADDWDTLSTEAAIHAFLQAGAPPHKLVLGVPFYGRAWQGVGPTNNGLRQPAAGVPQGTFEEPGMMDYWDIEGRLTGQPSVYQRHWDPVAKSPFVYAPSLNGGTFITYEDRESLRHKTDFLQSKGLRGVMFWELSNDKRDGSGLLPLLVEELWGP